MLTKKGLNVVKASISPVPLTEETLLVIDENLLKDGVDEIYFYRDITIGDLYSVSFNIYLSDGEIENGDYKWYLLGGGAFSSTSTGGKYVESMSEIRNTYFMPNIKAKAMKITILGNGSSNNGSSAKLSVVF